MAELNGQQVAAIEEKIRAHVRIVVEKLELRKWAMEKALAEKDHVDPVDLAGKIYDFVLMPALEPFKPD